MLKPQKTVQAYIAAAPKPARTMMEQLRAIIKSACPQAKEMISYAIPFYQYRSPGYVGRMIYFAAAKHHIGVYVVPRSLPPAVAKEVAKYKQAKSTLHFPIGEKIPTRLIRRLVRIRMKEIDQSLKVKIKKVSFTKK